MSYFGMTQLMTQGMNNTPFGNPLVGNYASTITTQGDFFNIEMLPGVRLCPHRIEEVPWPAFPPFSFPIFGYRQWFNFRTLSNLRRYQWVS